MAIHMSEKGSSNHGSRSWLENLVLAPVLSNQGLNFARIDDPQADFNITSTLQELVETNISPASNERLIRQLRAVCHAPLNIKLMLRHG